MNYQGIRSKFEAPINTKSPYKSPLALMFPLADMLLTYKSPLALMEPDTVSSFGTFARPVCIPIFPVPASRNLCTAAREPVLTYMLPSTPLIPTIDAPEPDSQKTALVRGKNKLPLALMSPTTVRGFGIGFDKPGLPPI